METKKYRASDMQEALAQINSELGPDAIIISSKLVRKNNGLRGLFEKRVYEVVAAYEVANTNALKFPDNKPRGSKPLVKNEPIRPSIPVPAREVQPATIKQPTFERYIQGVKADPEDIDRQQRIEAVEAAKRDFAILGASSQATTPFAEKAVKVELSAFPQSFQLPDLKAQAPRIITAAQTPAPKPAPQVVQEDVSYTATAADTASKAYTVSRPVSNTLSTVKVSLSLPKEEVDSVPEEFRDETQQLNGKKLGTEVLDDRLDEIKEMLQKVSDRFEYIKFDAKNGYSPKVEKLIASLISNGVNADIAHELARKTQQSVDQIQSNPQNVMRKLLKNLLGEPCFIRCERGKRRSIMLIGPTGVGKTTTLAKLAAYYAIKLNMNVGIINSDVYRMGAQEQLSAYAEIMNITNITIHTSEDIKSALDRFKDKDIVLIDTSGKLASDADYQNDIKTMIDVGEIDEVYLALCSTTSDRVCKEIINHYRFVDDYRLIVTKIDENVCFGNVVNISKYSGKPLSYLTNGQNVPDDILQVDIDEMVEKVMR